MRSLQNAGGAGVSTDTLGKCGAGTLARVVSLAAAAWVCPKAKTVGNLTLDIIGRSGD